MSPTTRRALPWLTAVAAALIISVTFWQGLQRGMDHAIGIGPEPEQTAIAIALSETVYGLDLGYVGHTPVYEALRAVWNRGITPSDQAALVRNSTDRALLNEAIASASSLPPLRPGYFSDRSLISGVYDDLGYVDFTKIAFVVFGRKVEAMYYLYFLTLALSAFCLLVSFRDRLVPQFVLLLALFGYFIELQTNLFMHGMPSFTGLRHGSTLVILPTWHLAFALIYRRPFSVSNVAGVAVQLLIMIIAIRIRGSAAWAPLFLVILAGVLGWWRAKGPKLGATVAGVRRWPVVLTIVALAVQALQFRTALHPIYFTDDVIPYHGLWHSAYLGLAADPGILPEFVQDFIAKGGAGDAIGAAGAMDYVERKKFIAVHKKDLSELPAGYISPWTGTVKFGLHDIIMRKAFFETVLDHPFRTLWLYLVIKPMKLVHTFVLYVFTPAFFGLMLLSTVAAYLAVRASFVAKDAVTETLVAGGLAAFLATAPSIFAFPGPSSIVDLMLVLTAVVPLATAVGLVRLRVYFVRRTKRT